MRRLPFVVALAVGLGLAAAPLAFQMFDRAPKGAVMLDEFRPFMTEERIGNFQRYMVEIDEAVDESDTRLRPFLAQQAGIDDAEFETRFSSFNQFAEEWPAIDADMTDLLDTVDASIDNYEAVDALPPFTLFAWFFVIPGLLIAGVAVVALVAPGRRRVLRWVLVGLGIALIAAPFAFQMFTRAPKGGEMMDDFETLMTRERVQTIQGYFSSMSVGEGGIRLGLVPAAEQEGGLTAAEFDEQFPAVSRLGNDWITIINDMTPMIGAMSDNVDNYDAIAALPPFPLFPFFFVLPGAIVAGVALGVGRTRRRTPSDQDRAPRTSDRLRSPEPERKPVMSSHALRRLVPALLAVTLVAAACDDDNGGSSSDNNESESASATGGAEELVGTFELDPGECDAGGLTGGSYLQLVLPGGSVEDGPFFENPDSACDVKGYTIVSPGTDGGLVTGEFQPHPEPPFDATGNSLAEGIIEPQSFTAIAFSVSSNETDPQTGDETTAPSITFEDSELTGDVSAIAASWNNEFFNQGSPKPDGSAPGLTSPVTGTYDPDTGEFVLEWSSQIVGGPVNDITGIWHLEGTFEPSDN